MHASGIITLLTDFGEDDGFVGIMKGVILNINPQASIVDITHRVPSHNIEAGSFILYNSYKFFPPGTIHVAIVDPGVGSSRKAIAVQTKDYVFIAPDNQILKYIFHYEKSVRVFGISNQKYFLEHISNTFHGRDIFAPCAAYLSRGTPIEELGSRIDEINQGEIFKPIVSDTFIEGQIIYIDKFGNLITNIPASLIQHRKFKIRLENNEITSLSRSYSEEENSFPIALIGSSGFLEIVMYRQHAAYILNLKAGDKIKIELG